MKLFDFQKIYISYYLQSKMKYKIPYYKQTQKYTCGIANLRMALAYLGIKISFQKLKFLTRILDSGMALPEGLLVAVDTLGLKATYYAQDLKFHASIPYRKKGLGKDGPKVLKELKEEIKMRGIEIRKRNLSVNELLGYLSKNSIPIVLVNAKILLGEKGFGGHYLTISGYDKKNIYAHNSGKRFAMPYWPLKRKLFEKAWATKYADKKTIIIKKK